MRGETVYMQDIDQWYDKDMVDTTGSKVGTIAEIYLDKETDQPEFALVNTGLFGTRLSFVPLAEAASDGDEVTVPYDKAQVKDAPQMEADGELSPDEEAELYRYYGLSQPQSDFDGGLSEETDRQNEAGTDDAITRSEEEVTVGKTEREVGRARLRKYVVTEHVQQTVPVRREEVRVETEPITEDNLDSATSGSPMSEEEHEMVLHEEQPVVEKRTVPKERVRLAKDEYTEEQEVSEEVRKEQIEAEGDISPR